MLCRYLYLLLIASKFQLYSIGVDLNYVLLCVVSPVYASLQFEEKDRTMPQERSVGYCVMSILGGWTCYFRVKKIGKESLVPILCKSIELTFRDSLSKIWSLMH